MAAMTRTRPSTSQRRASVSVVIPCFNYGHFLPACLQSVLRQPGVEVDVLVIDDASTDGSAEVAGALAATDPRVRLLRHERNLGLVETIREGLLAVDGEYVVKLDADDLLTPGALERATALLDAHPEAGFVYGRPVHFTDAPPAVIHTHVRAWTMWSGRDWAAERCRRAVNCISNPEVVMRASAVRAAGAQHCEVPGAGDLELWLRLASVADVGRIDADQAYYRVHGASMSRTEFAGALPDLSARRDAFDAAFGGVAGTLVGAPGLHATARRALAIEALDRACRAYDRGHTTEVPIDDLVEFALQVWPDTARLPGWRALERRRRVGARYAPVTPPFVVRAVVRRMSEEIGHRRWLRSGV
jgi:Glycosyl transferase family 2